MIRSPDHEGRGGDRMNPRELARTLLEADAATRAPAADVRAGAARVLGRDRRRVALLTGLAAALWLTALAGAACTLWLYAAVLVPHQQYLDRQAEAGGTGLERGTLRVSGATG